MEVIQKFEFKIVIEGVTYSFPAAGATVREARLQAIKDVRECLRQLEENS